ncbi:hypothetical protein TELCIR_05458 [Teladorsagia circumcincta]|uniref:Uncharacterized protein n=1 Tax=Teladorsagia circumcincta TaxID=45464 RepID=A0A2G9UR26_TELCI|nr:hypothetical protein TELCIR_05458 [Teladorsagia circumcincta]
MEWLIEAGGNVENITNYDCRGTVHQRGSGKRILATWSLIYGITAELFQGNRTFVVLLIPLFYLLYFTFFTPPLIFNSDRMAWFFATFAEGHDIDKFFNYPHTANNLLIVILTCLLYVQYSRVLFRHSRASIGLTWAQKSSDGGMQLLTWALFMVE